ncbi:hypothetical protein CCACVL1_28360 [Corchorus capsularis]|uniref:Uncharacterized protein n=1 Tax=Corchorus capsularis TaxID=210143 RepID=A0A1R3G6R7_COCAP|nr:hypothetical protein CCACVL1_28360 [Corchorus capsularis]
MARKKRVVGPGWRVGFRVSFIGLRLCLDASYGSRIPGRLV